MSQYGMQMPGGRSSRGPSMGVIDALLVLAIVAMGFASVYMFFAAQSVSPNGKVWEMHEDNPNALISLPE